MAITVFDKPEIYNSATQSVDGLMSAVDKTKLDGIATGATANTGTITGITMNGASKGTSGVVDLGTVITSHQDISGKVNGPASSTDAHIAVFNGTGGKTIKDSGYTIATSVPANAKFTDTTYSAATQSANGLMSSTDKTKLDGIATGATANTGTITGITMNGASKGTSGVVDLGTVLTAHQDISGKVTGPASATANAVAIFDGTGGKTIKNSGFTIGTSVPANAVFTDTDKSTKFTCIKQISRGASFDPNQSGYFAGMTTSSGIDGKWWHLLSMDWTGDTNSWISQLALPTHDALAAAKGIQYRTINGSSVSNWVKCLDTDNYSSYAAKQTEAVKSISRNGTTFTATRCDGTSFTFTQQDNNTWTANSSSAAGYVASGSGQNSQVWKTDASGNPAWRADANTTYSFTANNPTLRWGNQSQIGTAGGATYKVTMPADPTTSIGTPFENATYGNYFRLPGGIQICYIQKKISNVACTNQWGSCYESQQIDLGSWPTQFLSGTTPCAFVTVAAGMGCWTEYLTNTSNTAIGKTYFVRPNANTADVYVNIIGIGRHK